MTTTALLENPSSAPSSRTVNGSRSTTSLQRTVPTPTPPADDQAKPTKLITVQIWYTIGPHPEAPAVALRDRNDNLTFLIESVVANAPDFDLADLLQELGITSDLAEKLADLEHYYYPGPSEGTGRDTITMMVKVPDLWL